MLLGPDTDVEGWIHGVKGGKEGGAGQGEAADPQVGVQRVGVYVRPFR